MLDETMHFPKRESQEYPPLPKGIYQAELLEVKAVQNETYDSKKNNKNPKEYQTDLVYQFTLLSGKDKDGQDLRGRNVWENFGSTYLYISTSKGKNNLYRIVEAFLGRELSQEEEANGIGAAIINSFVGKQIMLSIEPKTTKQGKTFDRIADYFHAPSALPRLTEEEKEKARVKKDDEVPAELNVNEVSFKDEAPNDEAIPNPPY
jgi:hypothetical protein